MTANVSHDHLASGLDALSRGGWEDARAAFERAVAQEESPEALEGLATATWWLNDETGTFHARERCYQLYRQRGERLGAARAATWLADDYLDFRGEEAVSSGWRQRAHRLLDGMDPAPEHGWLAASECYLALSRRGDIVEAWRLAADVVSLGRSLAVTDLEMLGLALQGLVLVTEGAVSDGMLRLDEAAAAATSGDMTDLTTIGLTCCYTVLACEQVRDFDRAAQWCERMKEFCRRWRFGSLLAVCRTHYAAVLIWRGKWAEAEAELMAATGELAATRPAMVPEGMVRLADLRRRQGRFEEAGALFRQTEQHALTPLGRAALFLDQGDPTTAAELAERYLRSIPSSNRTQRAAGLEILLHAQAGLGDTAGAAATLRELQQTAEAVGTGPLRASAVWAEGILAAARGEHAAARRSLEDAVDLFARHGALVEAARARIELAHMHVTLGRTDAARREARAALDVLQQSGAAAEASRAQAVIREADSPEGDPTVRLPHGLSGRERQVLGLIAAGMSNREIANELVLSTRTVERHISNIYAKIGARRKADAIAYALRNGLG